ncbi:MAG: hypothetical protein KJO79_04710 [Verrucomicrobiae bacterium]|nr:hypothetical protein [Verrucomicrobiae bacterium]NNJ86458.1 hypothetical protein [Akkermansiaceae bacterium]
MNAITLSATTLALGVMVGITVTHHHQVNSLVERGLPAQATPAEAPVYHAVPNPQPQSTQPVVLASSDAPATRRPEMPIVVETSNYRDDALLEILAAIRNEQKTIRRQISESNRDLDELTFRVDSHSDSFKPLRTEVERPRPIDTITPPASDSGGLLPPKNPR